MLGAQSPLAQHVISGDLNRLSEPAVKQRVVQWEGLGQTCRKEKQESKMRRSGRKRQEGSDGRGKGTGVKYQSHRNTDLISFSGSSEQVCLKWLHPPAFVPGSKTTDASI